MGLKNSETQHPTYKWCLCVRVRVCVCRQASIWKASAASSCDNHEPWPIKRTDPVTAGCDSLDSNQTCDMIFNTMISTGNGPARSPRCYRPTLSVCVCVWLCARECPSVHLRAVVHSSHPLYVTSRKAFFRHFPMGLDKKLPCSEINFV